VFLSSLTVQCANKLRLTDLQVAMAKLKAAVRTIGDHKQRITVNVSIEGIKIIDEKTEVYFVCDCNQLLNFNCLLDHCNPWPQVTNHHISISRLKSL